MSAKYNCKGCGKRVKIQLLILKKFGKTERIFGCPNCSITPIMTKIKGMAQIGS